MEVKRALEVLLDEDGDFIGGSTVAVEAIYERFDKLLTMPRVTMRSIATLLDLSSADVEKRLSDWKRYAHPNTGDHKRLCRPELVEITHSLCRLFACEWRTLFNCDDFFSSCEPCPASISLYSTTWLDDILGSILPLPLVFIIFSYTGTLPTYIHM